MLKFSTNNTEFAKTSAFGFDLDGTLYDEFEFIHQAYWNIADYIASFGTSVSREDVWNYMNHCWLEEGSAKTDLFQQAFAYASIHPYTDRIRECVRLYRESPFQLTLSARVRYILDTCRKESKAIFLVSDGDASLQRRKIETLGLKEWFNDENIFISGDYGKDFQKPGLRMLPYISKAVDLEAGNICYLGDRAVDEKFAASAGFAFYYAPHMQMIGERMREIT